MSRVEIDLLSNKFNQIQHLQSCGRKLRGNIGKPLPVSLKVAYNGSSIHVPNSLLIVVQLTRRHSIWKPLKGPINDWPLLVCDATTVARDLDYEPADLLYPNLQTENAPVYHRDTYNWYYLGDHKPSEMSAYEITTTTTATTTLLVV